VATANRNTPAVTSRASQGASRRRPSEMTSSTMIFSTTGVNAETLRPAMDAPKAQNTSRRWAAR